jgi:hypothetical protein
MGAKRRRQSRMRFAPSHGRSLRPGGVGAERSSYSCSSIYCLQPFRLKARSGWPLSLSKHIMTRSGSTPTTGSKAPALEPVPSLTDLPSPYLLDRASDLHDPRWASLSLCQRRDESELRDRG